ncbi:MAG: phosphohistidine phosphatase SixA [Ignavibacteria bacterium]|nr:phosphohistidine phosphatase SixA [Ignavibacteria bacterium]MBI3765634.1 phosphohistidine phosphatase SixA [Ignavibacteriales bacterium]
MHLYFLRHGDATESAPDDASRPLTMLGQEQARIAAETLKKLHVVLEGLLCSPLLRARQTAEIVRRELNVKELIVTEYLVPSTAHRQIIDKLNAISHQAILLVGHEPHLSTLASLLISGTRNSRIIMKKGSLACLEVAAPIEPGNGVLRWLMSPEEIRRLQ